MRFQEKGRELILTGLLYADDLVLCRELEKRFEIQCRQDQCDRVRWGGRIRV